MNLFNTLPKRYLRPMVRSAETPRRLLTVNSVGHLRVAFFFNFLKINSYEQFNKLQCNGLSVV